MDIGKYLTAFWNGANYGKTSETDVKEKKKHQAAWNAYQAGKQKGSTGTEKTKTQTTKTGTSSSSGSGSGGSSGGSSTGSNAGASKTSQGKLIIEDATSNAIKTKQEKVVNKANDYTAFITDIVEDEHKMSSNVPNFEIYISFEKLGGEGVQESTTTTKVTEEQLNKEE